MLHIEFMKFCQNHWYLMYMDGGELTAKMGGSPHRCIFASVVD
jgi:hypothetical protein